MRKFIILVLFFQVSILASGFQPPPGRGLDVLHYTFNIGLSDSTDMIRGEAEIIMNCSRSESTLILDLKNADQSGKGMTVSGVLYNGSPVKWTHSSDLLKVEHSGTTDSAVVIKVSYSGIPADGLIISRNKYGNRTFFADHWPDRACNYLPVNDNPADKAAVEFIIKAPSHYKVVGSGYLVEESDMPGGTRLTHWKEDIPIATKVMTFGAAAFAMQYAGSDENIPVWTYVYPENRTEGFSDYSVALKPLSFYIGLIGPYSYEKLANVQSKTIFGGLENAGCIFYSENSVTGRGRAESLIAHEIAHQWFGNSVTEKEWHHIWLSEGFATYLTSVYLEMNYGKDRLIESMKSARDRVIRAYDRSPAPVIDTTVTDLMDLLNANSYQKGAWVLHMLRNELGDEVFWRGIRLFYSRYRNENALTDDFAEVMKEVSGRDLGSFFHQWLNVAGQPDLKISWAGSLIPGKKDITIQQDQLFLYKFSLEIGISDKNGIRKEVIPISGRTTHASVNAEKEAEMIIDPDVRLLFRQMSDQRPRN